MLVRGCLDDAATPGGRNRRRLAHLEDRSVARHLFQVLVRLRAGTRQDVSWQMRSILQYDILLCIIPQTVCQHLGGVG